jgi:hypothetical protein
MNAEHVQESIRSVKIHLDEIIIKDNSLSGILPERETRKISCQRAQMTHRCGGPTAGAAPQSESLRQLISPSVASAHKRSARFCPAIPTPAAPKKKLRNKANFFSRHTPAESNEQ